jgi:UDP-glucose:(heptosyl)LPS alpha-1,3-glucosyltransferase
MFTGKHVVLLKSRAGNCGGLEKYASRIALGFVEKGAKVSVLTTGSPKQFLPSVSFYPVKTSPWPAFLRMEQFDRFAQEWLKKERADLVFGMDRNRFQTHVRAGNGVHVAYLKSRILTEGKFKHWICLLNPMHRKILELEKEAFENPKLEKLFANSHMIREQILEHYAIDPAKIQVIHNGVEWEEMEADFSNWKSGRVEACKQFQLDPSLFHFLFIGNGYLRKGLGRLLEGLARLKRRDFHLSVIGKDNRMERFQTKAVQLGLKKNVRFFGPRPEIRLFYQLADVLAIPSFYDPFANVTVEALAMGLFVLSSKQNGGHEILHRENGAVIENLLDPDAMAEALELAMRHPKTERSASMARQSAAHLDFSKQLRKLIEACG